MCTAMLYIIVTILSTIDKGLPTGTVYLDLKKTFDTVDHATHLSKCHTMGIEGTEQDWFGSYLTDRQTAVCATR